MPKRKLTDFIPDVHNANVGTERGAIQINDSLRNYGAGRSILVDKNNRIIAGNKTWQESVDQGFDDAIVVPTDGKQLVVVQRVDIDLDTPKGRALAIADNRTSEVSLSWNPDELRALADDGVDLSAFWREDELAELLADVDGDDKPDPGPQIDRAAELQQKWQVKSGDVWEIGKHRLLCGDSTKAEDVARVMRGEPIRVVVTSPPYADQRDYEIGDFDWHALAVGVFEALTSQVAEDCDILINLGLSHKDGRVNRYWDTWLNSIEDMGWPLYGWYVWDKGSGFPGEWNGRLAPAHEFVFHFNRGRISAKKWIETSGESAKRGAGGKRFRQKDGSLKEVYSPNTIGQPFKVPDSVIRIGREMARGIHTEAHPAVYPVEFASFMLQTWSRENDAAFEPFLGSGTTLVACEQTGRRGRAIEIEPKYVAVSLERLSLMCLVPQRAEA